MVAVNPAWAGDIDITDCLIANTTADQASVLFLNLSDRNCSHFVWPQNGAVLYAPYGARVLVNMIGTSVIASMANVSCCCEEQMQIHMLLQGAGGVIFGSTGLNVRLHNCLLLQCEASNGVPTC